ncbi:MAG: Na/Pi cotransporter family protein [Hyphomicrobiales bacterium]
MTPGTTVIVNLLGGVALLLWGVRMVRTGVLRAWGDALKRFIENNLSNRATAFASGTVATLMLQSGTATALIITGLANSGVIGAATGIAVLLGADLGSAVVSAVFAIAGPLVTPLSSILLFAGFVVFSVSTDFRPRNAGRILMGLGLMLLALNLVVSASEPLREATLFHIVLATIGHDPLLALIVGAAVSWMSYSTLAVVLLIASFLASGSLETGAAMALILGVNLGGGLPALTATAGQPRAARRLPMANLACRAVLAIALVPALGAIGEAAATWIADPVVTAVTFHVAFNLLLALIFLPFAGIIMRGIERALPSESAAADPLAAPRYLDRSALNTPAVALSNAQTETGRMTELLDRMLVLSMEVLSSGSIERLKELRLLDEKMNAYQSAIHAYVVALMEQELEQRYSRRAMEIMLYVSNLEHAGDIIHLNLADRIKSKTKENVSFTESQTEALAEIQRLVSNSLRIASNVLASGDVEGARRLIEQKAGFRDLEHRIIEQHFEQRTGGRGKSLRASAIFVDIIRDLHRINSHIVSAAYPIVDRAGLLRETRLRTAAKTPE